MDGSGPVLAATTAFVGTHLLLSHPLRAPLTARLGRTGFMAVYSLVALVTLVWLVLAFRAAPEDPVLWPVRAGAWAGVTAVMLLASILLLGSLIGNPALPGGPDVAPAEARGVYTITRHPMMWAVALWGICHIGVYPTPKNLILAGGMILLALVGSFLQDLKKDRLQPEVWAAWRARTSWLPFAAILSGRARLQGFRPHDLLGGGVLWLGATWLHMPFAHVAAGVWRWI